MEKKINIEGFFDNPFFIGFDSESRIKAIESRLKQIRESQFDSNETMLYKELIEIHKKTNKSANANYYKFSEEFELLVKKIIIERFIQYDLLKYFFDEESENKIKNLIERNQIKSKMISICANRIAYIFHFVMEKNDYSNRIEMLIDNDLFIGINKIIGNHILQNMKSLKEVLDKAISGVKESTYLEFERDFYSNISVELKSYINTKHGNSLFSDEYIFGAVYEKEDAFLKKVLLDDDKVWDKSWKTLGSLLNCIERENDLKHAEKLIDYIYDKACKNIVCKYLYDNKLPLFISEDYSAEMIDLNKNIIERRVSGLLNGSIDDEESRGFLVPLYKGFDEAIKKGENIFNSFIKNAYPSDNKTIIDIFKDTSTIIQDESSRKKKLSIGDMLESNIFGFDTNSSLKKFMYAYYDDFGTSTSILSRLYYRCYLIDKYADKTNECIYEYLFDILHMISIKFGINPIYITDNTLRENKYALLKKELKKYGLEIDDEYKHEYIIALLDRKYATVDEVERFAELEQFGDAIYELAIDEILFYNPNTSLTHEEREKYVKAESQVEVAKRINLDKLYISNFHDSLNTKYLEYEKFELGLHNRNSKENYIADSLEMILAVVARNFSIESAIKFAINLILETYTNLEEPHKVEFDIAKSYNSNVDMDYLQKIYPNPFFKDDYCQEYFELWNGIAKILSICILGNETKGKRSDIAYANYKYLTPDFGDYYKYVVSYLYNGIEKTISDFKPIVESNYRK